jgi:branched-subunit amino acid ABC-type transport system permease component
MEAISIIYGILLGIGASVFYAVVGYIKEAVKSNEDFDYNKMTRTAIIGAILGVLIYAFGYDPKVAQDYAPVIFTVIGGNVIVEKIVKAVEYKLKKN